MAAVNKPEVAGAGAATHVRLGQRLVERIGNTPLLRMERVTAAYPNVEIYAKAEWFNPGGSVKDRAAYSLSLIHI